MILPFYEEVVNDSKGYNLISDYKKAYSTDGRVPFIGYILQNGIYSDVYLNHSICKYGGGFWGELMRAEYNGIEVAKKRVKTQKEIYVLIISRGWDNPAVIEYFTEWYARRNNYSCAEARKESMDYLKKFHAPGLYEAYAGLDFQNLALEILECQDLKKAMETLLCYAKGELKGIATQVLGWSKVERISKTITTTRLDIYEYFYNYLLMDFRIFQIPKVEIDKANSCIKEIKWPEFSMYEILNEGLKEELEEIKAKTPLYKRKIFLRN